MEFYRNYIGSAQVGYEESLESIGQGGVFNAS